MPAMAAPISTADPRLSRRTRDEFARRMNTIHSTAPDATTAIATDRQTSSRSYRMPGDMCMEAMPV